MFKGIKHEYVGLLPLLMFVAIFFLIAATYVSFKGGDYRIQLSCLFCTGVFFCIIDGIMARHAATGALREDFSSSFLFNDLPITFAFFVLLIFAFSFKHLAEKDEMAFRVFIGGAIAFQMLLSNWVFALAFAKPGFSVLDDDSGQANGGTL